MAVIKIGPSIESLAGDFVWSRTPQRWTGTLASLNAYIGQSTQQCADYVHQQNWTTSKANAASACQQKLQERYRDDLSGLQGDQKNTQDLMKNEAFGPGIDRNTIIMLGIIILVIVLLVVLFKK